MKSTKLRAGLYRVEADNGASYLVEDRWFESTAYPWRITNEGAFNDPWRGDFATKREALAEIEDNLSGKRSGVADNIAESNAL